MSLRGLHLREGRALKIVQIVTQMEAGGAQGIAYSLHVELQRRGHCSEVWFLYTKRQSYSGLPGVRSLFPNSPSVLGHARILVRLLSWLNSAKADVVITHTHYANVMGQLSALLCSKALRIAVQHSPVENYPRLARIADRIIGSVGAYDCNVCVSRTVIDSIAHHPRDYRKLIHLIYNGIPQTSAGRTKEQVRTRWSIPCDVPVLIYVGRFNLMKNHRMILEMMPRLLGVWLVLVGDGELNREIRQVAHQLQVSDRVCFTGEISLQDVRDFLGASDLFVFPSLVEAMGLAMIEAMSAGLPIISSDIPSSREFLGSAGVLVDINNTEEWISTVRLLLAQEDIAGKLAEASIKRAKDLTVEKMVDGYESLFVSGGRRDSE